MAESTKSTLSTLREGHQPVSFNKSDIRYQTAVTAQDTGLNEVSNALLRKHRENRSSNLAERRERELSDNLQAKLDQETGVQRKPEYTDAQNDAYNSAQFISDTSKTVQNALSNIDMDDFYTNLTAENRDESIKGIKDTIHKAVAVYGVEGNEGALRSAIALSKSVNEHFTAGEVKYNTETLPTRTIGLLFDASIGSNSSKQEWSSVLQMAQADNVSGDMDKTSRDVVLMGEILRATEADDLQAYPALRDSKVWERMNSRQKRTLTSSHETAVVQANTRWVNKISDGLIQGFRNIDSVGDLSVYAEADAQIAKLPVSIRSRVEDKISTAREKSMVVGTMLNKLKIQEAQPNAGIQFTGKEGDDALAFITKQVQDSAAMSGENVTQQQATQMASLSGYRKSIRSDNSHGAYNLQGDIVNNTLNAYQLQAVQGGMKLQDAGYDSMDLQNIMGKDNASVYYATRSRMASGMSVHDAMTEVSSFKEVILNKTGTEKALSNIEDLEEADSKGVFDTIYGILDDVASLVPVPTTWKELRGTARTSLDTDQDLYTEVATDIDPVGVNTMKSGVARHTQIATQQAWLDFSRENTWLPVEERIAKFTAFRNDIAKSNFSPIYNQAINNKMKLAVGGDGRKVSRLLSRTNQQLSSMLTLPTSTRLAIQEHITDVTYSDANGTIRLITDPEERASLLASGVDGVKSKINIERFYDVQDNGLRVNGRTIPPFEEIAENAVGSFDSGRKLRTFQPHSIKYNSVSKSFIMTGLNPLGNDLVFEEDIIDEVLVNGKFVPDIEHAKGTNAIMSIDEDLVMMFMQANNLDLEDIAVREEGASNLTDAVGSEQSRSILGQLGSI